MDKIGTILINREQVQKMLGGLSKSAFFKLVKKWKDAGTPFPEPVKGMPALKRGGSLYMTKSGGCKIYSGFCFYG